MSETDFNKTYPTNEKPRLTRRQLLAGLGATGAALLVGGGVGIKILGGGEQANASSESDITPTETTDSAPQVVQSEHPVELTPTNEASEEKTVAEIEANLIAASDPGVYEGREDRDPELLRQIVEENEEPTDILIEQFQISPEEADDPKLFAKRFAEVLEKGLNAGCTPEEVAPYINTSVGIYLADMVDKYTLVVFRGIFNPTFDSEHIQYITESNEYQSFKEAHVANLTRYYVAASHGNPNQSIRIDTGETNAIERSWSGEYTLTPDYRVTDHFSEIVPTMNSYDITNPLPLKVSPLEDKTSQVTFFSSTSTQLFDKMAA